MKHYKVIDGELYAISLVEDPAMESDFVALSKHKAKIQLENEKRMVTGAALIPNKPIYRNQNGNEYYMTFDEASIEKLSQNFMEYIHWVTVDHKEAVDDVVVVESWIKTSENDKSVALGLNEPIGTWFVSMKVNNDGIWNQIKNGEYKGFSIEAIVNLDEIINNTNVKMSMDKEFIDKLKEIIYEAMGKTPEADKIVEETVEEVVEETKEEVVELDEKDDEIAKLKEDVENLSAEVERLKAERDELQSKLDDAMAEKEKRDKEYEEVKTEMAKMSKMPSTKPAQRVDNGSKNYGAAIKFMMNK